MEAPLPHHTREQYQGSPEQQKDKPRKEKYGPAEQWPYPVARMKVFQFAVLACPKLRLEKPPWRPADMPENGPKESCRITDAKFETPEFLPSGNLFLYADVRDEEISDG